MKRTTYPQLENISVSFEDGFEVVTMYGQQASSHSGGLYPINTNLPYSLSPGIPSYGNTAGNEPIRTNTVNVKPSHPLDGIPFKLSPALESSYSTDNDQVLMDVKKTLDRVKNILTSDDFKYDFTLEKNYLKETVHCDK